MRRINSPDEMARSFRNIILSIVSVLLMVLFVGCLIILSREELSLPRTTAVIGAAILSFFISLYLLMLIKSRKK
ncbi:MAG TPA: hypothetical protein PKH02_01325 [Bacteroidales bacterium]|nr:hypothetical protein [Bacteroidales bacterium]HPT11209.1 hypothetical protein [Bacteroidales bacterium]